MRISRIEPFCWKCTARRNRSSAAIGGPPAQAAADSTARNGVCRRAQSPPQGTSRPCQRPSCFWDRRTTLRSTALFQRLRARQHRLRRTLQRDGQASQLAEGQEGLFLLQASAVPRSGDLFHARHLQLLPPQSRVDHQNLLAFPHAADTQSACDGQRGNSSARSKSRVRAWHGHPGRDTTGKMPVPVRLRACMVGEVRIVSRYALSGL